MLKRLISLSILLLSIAHADSNAQVFTAFGLHFDRTPMLDRVGFEYSAIATIDVQHGVPVIKKIVATPAYQLADTEVRKYINALVFIRDTSNYTILFFVKVNRHLMNAYSEVSGDSITLVFPYCPSPIRDPISIRTMEYDADRQIVKITMNALIRTDSYLQKDADIRVERIFRKDKDSTIIIRNNYPEAEKEILEGSKYYRKENFEDELQEIDPKVRYFLEVHLYHVYPCDIKVEK
jgi:hypothetical protein